MDSARSVTQCTGCPLAYVTVARQFRNPNQGIYKDVGHNESVLVR